MKILKKIKRFFIGETYQDVLDRKYGGVISSNLLVNDRELNSKLSRCFKIKCSDIYGKFNKKYFRKKKIDRLFI